MSALTPSKPDAPEPTALQTAEDPILFANWLNRHVVTVFSFEEDLGLAPNEEECVRLQITRQQKKTCAREYLLLRALGACLFVRYNLAADYLLAFKEALFPAVAERLTATPPARRLAEVSDVIERYLAELEADSPTGFSGAYLERVYAGNPNLEAMFAGGVAMAPFQYAVTFFEHARNGFCLLKFGVPFDKLKELTEGQTEGRAKSAED